MHPTILSFHGVIIYSFGLFLALGIVAGGLVMAALARGQRLTTRGLFDNILFVIFCGVIGARLGYVVLYPQFFHSPDGSWTQIFALWQGGLLIYGAIIGGGLASWIVTKNNMRTVLRWFDLFMFAWLIGVAFGQTGCLLGGCAVGITSGSRFTIDHRIPVQLYEGLWALLLFAGCLTAYLMRAPLRKGGRIFFTGAFLYLFGRLILDAWRPTAFSWHGTSGLILADVSLISLFLIAVILAANRPRSFMVEEFQ